MSEVATQRPSFEAVYRGELRYVWNSLRRLGIADRWLEDLSHDVFVVVHRQLPAFDPTRPLRPWLFGIVYRVALGHQRRFRETREVLGPEATERPTDPWQAQLDREEVLLALMHLDLQQRTALVMHDLDGWTAEEIAGVLEVEGPRVYSILRAARRDFRRAVEGARVEGRR